MTKPDPAALANAHLSDEEIVLAIDGELEPARAAGARTHMDGCPACRRRLGRLERSARDLTSMRATLAADLSAAPGGGARLLAAAALVAALGGLYAITASRSPVRPPAASIGQQIGLLPLPYLTPGSTRPVTAGEICARRTNGPQVVPAALRQDVVRAYGMGPVEAHEYELDYLITPALGGGDDTLNLWPERYTSGVWNARVKDELEDLLPRLVCEGRVPLATAQHDIATNWIAAYQKYFHTDMPLWNEGHLPDPVIPRWPPSPSDE